MNVLVTGGAGYIGSHMVLALVDQGIQTVVLDNLSTGNKGLISDQATFVEGDAGDGRLVTELIRRHDIDAVIHFAGSIVVPDSVSDPIGYYHNNTVKSHSLIQSCIETGVRHFIFSSTAAVYGIPEVEKVSEDAQLLPISPYGTSKLMTELMLRDAALAHDFDYVALRYFNVAGADPLGRSGQSSQTATHLLKVAMQVATGQRDILQIFGKNYDTRDGTCIRDYIHVSDLVSAHMDALNYLRSGNKSGVFNCGYETGTSVLELVDSVQRVIGKKLPTVDAPPRAGDPACLIAKAGKIRDSLDWKQQYGIDDIIRSAYNWEQSLIGNSLLGHNTVSRK